MSNSLYEQDFYAWATEQAALLRAGRLADADVANIAEEIESLGRGERRELTNRLAVLLAHLLKWHAQPERRGRSWLLSVREQRRQVERLMNENPSLRPVLPEIMDDAYGDAVLMAAREMERAPESLPPASPWTYEQALTEELAWEPAG